MAGTPSGAPTDRPLLPVGRHEKTIEEVRAMCVDAFPLSTTRPQIMDGLEQVVDRFRAERIEGELWVDGSFVTDKINASDVDVALRIDGLFHDNATHTQHAAIDWLETVKNSHRVDGYVFPVYPENDPRYWFGEYEYAYSMKQWGFDRGDNMKGIAVLSLP